VQEARAEAGDPRDTPVPSAEEMYQQGICVGTPDDIIRTIERYRAIGIDQLVFTGHTGYGESVEVASASLRLMGKAVLPAVRGS
jgi:alkanesulfonate monooxygenase SsuD/methylene tetrahydromethanopterin reductase-like flavin-dependent oxidoreductase (luciferase family)